MSDTPDHITYWYVVYRSDALPLERARIFTIPVLYGTLQQAQDVASELNMRDSDFTYWPEAVTYKGD